VTILLQREAKNDLEDATFWYEDQIPGLGKEFIGDVIATFDRIEENPESFPVVYKQLRRALVHRFPFCVFFAVDDDRILVVAVLHGSRDPNRWQSRV